LIDDFTREIDHDQRASEDPYVEVLCQIRGVGRYIARLVIAEIGDITPADHVPPSLTVSDHSSELACCQWPLPRP
jgi:hypothetical protein